MKHEPDNDSLARLAMIIYDVHKLVNFNVNNTLLRYCVA